MQNSDLIGQLDIAFSEKPRCFKLSKPCEEEPEEMEEVVLRVQGVLCQKDIAPIFSR